MKTLRLFLAILFFTNLANAANINTSGTAIPAAGAKIYGQTDAGAAGWIDGDIISGIINVKAYGAVGDGTADDTEEIQAAISAAESVHGRVYFPSGEYKITSTINITDSVSLDGESLGSITLAYIPTSSPYLTGAVLKMATADTDAIRINAAKKSVNIKNLGIKFATEISFIDTGHGINVTSSNDGTGYPAMGIQDSTWDNVMVFGTDGDHYAYNLTNVYLNNFNHLRSYGGGGVNLFANNNSLGIGNNLFVDTYTLVCLGGTSHGYYLRGTNGTNGQNYLNTFLRMQSNKLSSCPTPDVDGKTLSAPGGTQYNISANQYNQNLSIYAPDFEGGAVDISSSITNHYITPGLGTTGKTNMSQSVGKMSVGVESTAFRFLSQETGLSFLAQTGGSAGTFTTPENSLTRTNAGTIIGSYYGTSAGHALNVFTYTVDGALFVSGNANVGINKTAPTAKLHLPASAAAADKASLKIDPGVVATTPASGNIESDGTHLYWTNSSGTRIQLDN